MATTQDKDEKESPKKGKGGKDLDDLKKEVPIVSFFFIPSTLHTLHTDISCNTATKQRTNDLNSQQPCSRSHKDDEMFYSMCH